ncbi:MAG TPA: phosphoribosyltransferase family protein [Thermomicrobiales bacterium]|nr:phosphoribosyltransferase family protein [Thermomicrobiales bacterium]
MAPFSDRQDAGQQLAARLAPYRDDHPIVLALPRGGVPVGYEIARALGAPLDVLVARKLGAPHQPEFGIGAIAPGGVRLLDRPVVEALGIPPAEIERIAAAEAAEMERREREFRDGRPPLDLAGRVVIVVDDGLATGVTARAAVAAVRARRPARIVLAAPVCSPEAARALGAEADDVLCLATPPDFRAVGLWYEDFEQTSDAEVVDLLRRARRAEAGDGGPGEARPGSAA